jgi:hypothetical protein
MLNNPTENVECCKSLLRLRKTDYSNNCIIACDLNIIRNSVEKRGVIFGRDPFIDNMEEIVLD